MAGNPWDADTVVEEHADDPVTPPAASAPAAGAADEPWNKDRGVYGSGGMEDEGGGDSPDPEQGKDGQVLLGYDQNPDGTKYPVYGKPETSRAGALGRGVADTAALGFSDEAEAGVEAAYQSLIGGKDFGDTYDNAVDRNRSYAKADEDQHGAFRIAGQLLGGLAIPTGLEGVAFRAGREALQAGLGMAEARALAARAVTTRMVQTGAAGGAAYGAGSADGDAGERLLGAGVGAATGAAGGLALGAAGQAIAPGLAARAAAARALPITEEQRVAAAAGRQNIDLLPADVGGPTTRRLTAAAAQAPLSASPIINAAQRVLQRGQQVAADAAGPTATDSATAGEALRTGAEGYIRRSSGVGGALYDRAARRAGDARIDPVEARQMLDDQIQRLEAVPGGGQGLEEARAMRESLDGQFSVQGIRDMRTEMFVDPALRGSPMDRRMRQVVDAAARDVENGLRSQGRGGAADAFRTADNFWRQRLETIDQVIEPVIGQPNKAKGGEAISKAVDVASKGDVVKLQRLLGTLPQAERGVVTGSLINRLGTANKGQQNAAGDAFSLSTFLSNWSQLSPRSRNVLFDGEQRAALEDLATVAGGVRNASKYANHSNTAGGIWGNLGLLASGAVASPAAAGAGLVTQLIGGRLLANPSFARWLARAPRTSLSHTAYVDRLGRIARANPSIANDVLALQSRLTEAMHGQPLAASRPNTDQNVDNGR